jgi:protein TonB
MGGLKMPLNVKRFLASIFLVVFNFIILSAQTVPTSQPTTQPTPVAPTSGEIMRARISKAKAYIAVKNYGAAIYEMENIRRETSDQTVHGVLNVLLMNCYLEQSDYKRAQDFLTDLFNGIKANKPNAAASYYAAAGQVIKVARNQSERYKALGLSVSDRNLTPDAVTDLENMRATLEKVVEQSKTLGKDTKQTANAFVLLEETTNARSLLARDSYDSKRWKDEVADSRETLANSRSTIMSAVTETPTETNPNIAPNTVAPNTVAPNTVAPNTVASNTVASNNPNLPPTNSLPVPNKTETAKTNETTPVFQPVSANPNAVALNRETQTTENLTAKNDKPIVNEQPKKEEPKKEEPKKIDETANKNAENSTVSSNQTRRDRRIVSSEEKKPTETQTDSTTAKTEAADSKEPLKVGSLLEFAVERKTPVYPASARQVRQMGVVRVELVVDENGQVTEVQNLSGPALLQSAARDAVKKWKFKPFLRDGQPVKATGFLNFNFSL